MVIPLALKLNDLVETVANRVSAYFSLPDSTWTLGLSCAGPESKHRSYLISLMTANAVLESKKKLGRSPQVVVLGTGSGLDVYVQGIFRNFNSKVYFGRIDFSEGYQSPIVLRHKFKVEDIQYPEFYVLCLMDLLDHNKNPVFKERFNFPSNFDLGHEGLFEFFNFNPKSDYELRISYHFSPDNNPEKANVTFEAVRLISIYP